jgi:alcohol dehydrogenase (cytochrome c)
MFLLRRSCLSTKTFLRLAAGGLSFVLSCAWGADVTTERLNNAEREAQNWLTYGGTYKSWRYSPLDQIHRGNIKKLVPVWSFEAGLIEGGLQATPLVVDGVLYLSTSWNRVFAIDAATGKEIWHYYSPRPKQIGDTPWNRGVAVADGLVFMGTVDNHVVALDAKTGREIWKVEVEDVGQCGCNISGAPLVVNSKVIVGVTGGDSAHRGYINAFDTKTGRHVWRFWTIPGPGEPGHDTWQGDSWKSGGGSSWLTGSYDAELNLLYWGIGNPAADFYGESRKGDNLYTDSIVALDPETGKLKWHYQLVPYDLWDWDAGYEMILADLDWKGQKRKVIVNPNKGGYTWVIDRATGEFLNAWPLVENINWITGIDEEGNLVGRNEPAVGVPSLICPAIGGGRSWNHGAYSPRTGFFYSTGIEWCQTLTVIEQKPEQGKVFFGGVFTLAQPEKGEPGGHLSAYDPISGKRHWIYRSKYPLLASQLATASDLLFTGDSLGRFFALDAKTGEELWSFRTGSGHRGSPITYAVNGKQYIAVPVGWGSALAGLMTQMWPEAADIPGASTLFVFALADGE